MYARSPRSAHRFVGMLLILVAFICVIRVPVARAATPQLLISEVFTDPVNADSPFEYVELVATGTIDFAIKPYSVVFTNNNTADESGWVIGGNGIGSAKSYGFSIASGTVSTGQIVYVGGSLMAPTGTKLRALDTGTAAGDGFGNASVQGVLGNGGSNADGVAVFGQPVGQITSSSVPVDALFFGTAAGTAVVNNGTAGYQLPVNDHYAGGKLQSNSFLAADSIEGQSLIASGVYDLGAGTWATQRTWANNLPTDSATAITFAGAVAEPTMTPQPQSSTRIHDIQGAAHISPFVSTVNGIVSLGQTVTDVPGVVTAVATHGFYMQDVSPDADPATSEGIFVSTGSAEAKPLTGDAVMVTGRVAEVRASCTSARCDWSNLTTTEITSGDGVTLTWTRSSSGNALPAATIIGNGGRVPPSTIIKDAVGDVEAAPNTFDPFTNGLDFYESLEGMRVQVNDTVVVGPTTSAGEIVVLGDGGANAGLRTARGGVLAVPNGFNPARIIVDDALTPNPPLVNVADRFGEPITGVLDYSNGNFKLLNTAKLPSVTFGNLAPETTIAPTVEELSVASFDVGTLSLNDDVAKFNQLATIIAQHLQSPDVIALTGTQEGTNGGVHVSETASKIIDAIKQDSGSTYTFRSIASHNHTWVGFLFRTDRGLAYIDRAALAGIDPSLVGTTAISGTNGVQLAFSPGLIDPTNSAFANGSQPLVGEFMFHGKHVFTIANQFISNDGDQVLFGRFQPPALASETQRVQQSQIINTFVRSLVAQDADARVVVAGNMNDVSWSNSLNTLTSGGLTDLITTLPTNERYSSVSAGNSEDHDHILVSNRLLADGVSYDVVHVNAEFAHQLSEHDPSVVRLKLIEAPAIPTPASPTSTPSYALYLPITGR